MSRERWEPKHTTNLILVICALISVVVLTIWADGAHVPEILGFVAGLLIPGSPIATLVGGTKR